MSLDINAATARLAREMNQSEASIADALVAVTSLMHTAAVASRTFQDGPAVQTQATFLHLNKLIGGLVEARGEAMRVHGQLLDIGREMAATEIPWCPDTKAVDDGERQAA
ncbi:MAG: hypothetical protein H2049_09255 [Porphyrobacter sp.]|nr:hypothetical protein [Porphyrobacter sp.]